MPLRFREGGITKIVIDETNLLQYLVEMGVWSIGSKGPAGGIIFYDKGTFTDGWRYLEAWTTDEDGGTLYKWKTENTAGGGSGTAIGTGYSNTYNDVGNNADYPAFKQCIDATHSGYSDWFLPSKDELNELVLQKDVVGGFADSVYWSSSEYSATGAWRQSFFSGDQSTTNKSSGYRVRAVRRF